MQEFKKVLDIYQNHKELITNESQTKQYLVTPILKLLGYDLTNPTEVISEFTADVAGRKGEKLDFVIKVNGKIQILIECKHHNNKLLRKDREQLERYFQCREEVDNARIAVFTNGVLWHFYSNSINPSQLDIEPFYTFNLEEFNLEDQLSYNKLMQFSKADFNFDDIFNHAKSRNRVLRMKSFFSKIFDYDEETKTEDVRKLLDIISTLGIDMGNQQKENKAREYYPAFLIARDEFIQEYPLSKPDNHKSKEIPLEEDKDIITEEEDNVYKIICLIASEYLEDCSKITLRNTAGIGNSVVIFDENQRKPIVYIRFAQGEKYITIGKDAAKIKIEKIADVYKYKTAINEAIRLYV